MIRLHGSSALGDLAMRNETNPFIQPMGDKVHFTPSVFFARFTMVSFCRLVGSLLLLCWLCASSASAAQQQPQAAKQYRYWTTDWNFEEIDLKVLAQRLKTLGVDIPLRVSGQATVNLEVSVPINGLTERKAYRFQGRLQGTDVRVDDLQFTALQAKIDFRDGVLSLDELIIRQGAGTLSGTASLQLIPSGSANAKLSAKDFELGPLARTLASAGLDSIPKDLSGAVAADLSAEGVVEQISRLETWTASGTLSIIDLGVESSFAYSLNAPAFNFEDNTITLPDFSVSSKDLRAFFLRGSANIPLSDLASLEVRVEGNDIPARDLLSIAINDADAFIDGKLDLRGTVRGSAAGPADDDVPAGDQRIPAGDTQPGFSPNVDLAIASPGLRVLGLDLGVLEHDVNTSLGTVSLQPRVDLPRKESGELDSDVKLGRVDARYNLTAETFQLESLEADLLGGNLVASGVLQRENRGVHQIDASWKNINPNLRIPISSTGMDAIVQAALAGSMDWSVPANKLAFPLEHRGKVNASITNLRLNNASVGGLDVNLTVDEKSLQLAADGQLFNGNVSVTTRAPLDETTRWRDVPRLLQPTNLVLANVSLQQALRVVQRDEPNYDAVVDGEIQFSLQPTMLAEGQLIAAAVSAFGRPFAPSVQVEFNADDHRIELRSISGTVAGGQLQASGEWSYGSGRRLLTARLIRVDGSRLLLPIQPDSDQWIGGVISARATIAGTGRTMMSGVRVTGSTTANGATSFGVPLGDAHTPFVVSADFQTGTWRATLPAVRSSIAKGSATGTLTVSSAASGRAGFHLDSRWRVNHVDFESLLDTYVGTKTIGQGELTGDFRLNGRYIDRVEDLRGDYRMILGGTDATAVPGLSAAGALLGAASLAGVRFDDGVIEGRIDRGNFVIENLAMLSDRMSVKAEGSVDLLDSRMAIKAVVATGNFQGQNALLQSIGTQALTEVIPLSTVNRLISDRTIVFELRGPTRDPILRLLTGETIRANAKRFATQEALGLIVADSLIFD
jgi:hypothetical protein